MFRYLSTQPLMVWVVSASALVSAPQYDVRGVQCRNECVINSSPDVARSTLSSACAGVALGRAYGEPGEPLAVEEKDDDRHDGTHPMRDAPTLDEMA
jgi:hypothetical protein